MPPEDEKGAGAIPTAPRPNVSAPTRTADTPIVGDGAEAWQTIRTGWARAGDAMPPRGSLAWRALPADDPVRLAAEKAAEFGVLSTMAAHGPAVARALTEDAT